MSATVRELYDSQDRDRLQRELRRLGELRDGLTPFGADGPVAWAGSGIYTLTWDQPGSVLLEVDFVTTDRHGETYGELAVYWSDPADPLATVRAHLNLISLQSRERLAASLGKRTAHLGIKWLPKLDQAARWIMERYRRGDPGLLLRDAEDLDDGADALTDPPLIEADGLSILFGDGGSLKSWIGLGLAASLQAGTSYIGGVEVQHARRVGYLDWEWTARRHKRRLLQLAGSDAPEVAYIRCTRPLHEERDRLRRFVRDFGLDFGVVDSVGLACGGEPESAEVATRFANTFGELFPAGLGIAHVTKAAADKAPDKPFGSAYWHNSARRTWYARLAAEQAASGAVVGLYNRKANDGPLSAPFSFAFNWADERVTIARHDVRETPELDNVRSIAVRMRELLSKRGKLALHVVAEELDEDPESVKRVARRERKAGRLIDMPGPDGIYRWGLKA
jgi:hypothetical protein